jgi:hypothetical protein
VPSTLGEERATNPFLRPGSPTIRRAVGCDAQASHAEVFTATRSHKDGKAYRALTDDDLPLTASGAEG